MRLGRVVVAVAAAVSICIGIFLVPSTSVAAGWGSGSGHVRIGCGNDRFLCTEVGTQEFTWGKKYVGHDEPSLLFYSNKKGSGYRAEYNLTLPNDPSPTLAGSGGTYNFQLTPAIWFGMAMCDTESAPNPGLKCKPDSDSNIKSNPAKAPGSAFTEMQFYPPGWVLWPPGTSCDPTKWCAALNIDSLSEDDLRGTTQNDSCASIAGQEYVNFAYITMSGKPQAPPNPVDSNETTFTPNPKKDLFMSSGDTINLKMFDTKHGLKVMLDDLTTHQSGSMVASAKNGFAQVKYSPNAPECTPIPYDFHPEYATSSPKTVVPWAAHTYNVAQDVEIGHFDWCNTGPNAPGPVSSGGNCDPYDGEGPPWGPWRWSDGDDSYCFPATDSSLVQVQGCIGENDPGFDGAAYLPDWPDGSSMHPTPLKFTSPKTGANNFKSQYQRVAFQTDTPATEIAPECYHATGLNCTRKPERDDGAPVAFEPFYWTGQSSQLGCYWGFGNDVSGQTKKDFGGFAQFKYLQHYVTLNPANPGTLRAYYENYGQTLPANPCPSTK